ncbi:MAG: adenylate/guanylate cyclase domain-containing protein [Pseudomonadota bacterium]
MTAPSGTGRLLTIVCADACGFTARTASDETESLAALRRAREVMGEVFAAHGGRILNTWGDGIIAVFETVRGALTASQAFQERWGRAEAGADDPLTFRFGINVDDVIDDGNDVYGHGVNLAARLQQAAPPGGIVVSDAVHATLNGRGATTFSRVEDMGLKPTDPPMAGWRVLREGEVAELPKRVSCTFRSEHRVPAERPAAARRQAGEGMPILARLNAQERGTLGLLILLWSINLTTSPGTIWAIYPSVPLLALCILRRLVEGVTDRP